MGRNGVEINISTQSATRTRSRLSQNDDGHIKILKQLVETNFIPWSVSQFCKPYKKLVGDDDSNADMYSDVNRAKFFRFKRNEKIRRLAYEEQCRIMYLKIDRQVHFKNQFSPSIIKMFPYEPQIAVAYKDKVSIIDLQDYNSFHCNPEKQKITKSSARSSFDFTKISKVSTIELINSHDIPMILIGHDNGMIRLWQEKRKNEGNRMLYPFFIFINNLIVFYEF